MIILHRLHDRQFAVKAHVHQSRKVHMECQLQVEYETVEGEKKMFWNTIVGWSFAQRAFEIIHIIQQYVHLAKPIWSDFATTRNFGPAR